MSMTVSAAGNVCWIGETDSVAELTLRSLVKVKTFVIVTDSKIERLGYLAALLQDFEDALKGDPSRRVASIVFPMGEESKTASMKLLIEEKLQRLECTRATCLLALGGGVVGDLVGFVAATYMRGIDVIQIPTTLLAMVDSSIGGKTAIDTPFGKNLVGAFHQPAIIFVSLKYLKTLPPRQFYNGMAEVVKAAVISSCEMFDFMEENAELIKNFPFSPSEPDSVSALSTILKFAIDFKANLVAADEREMGRRAILNFGHTIGHAIERLVFPNLLHGEAVAIGMALEAEVSVFCDILSANNLQRLVSLLEAIGLPTSLYSSALPGGPVTIAVEKILNAMRLDKKNQVSTEIRLVIVQTLGCVYVSGDGNYTAPIDDSILRLVVAPNVLVKSTLRDTTDSVLKVTVPGSKSISNRCLLLAALGSGVCSIKGLLHSEDTRVMLHALKKLVAGFSYRNSSDGSTMVVTGGAGNLRVPPKEPIYLGNAGTAARFLTSLMAIIGGGGVLTGNERMRQRPIGPLVQVLRANGADIEYLEREGCLPLRFGSANQAQLKGGDLHLDAAISSQYVSSILLCAPYFPRSIKLHLNTDRLVSSSYVSMTVIMMESFGVQVLRSVKGTALEYSVTDGKRYTNPAEYLVEGDASSATYPLAFAAISGRSTSVSNLSLENSIQGDALFAHSILEKAGCQVHSFSGTSASTSAQQLNAQPDHVSKTEGRREPFDEVCCVGDCAKSCGIRVCGPRRIQAIGRVDMEPLTDAFLTACVIAARASPGHHKDTEIYGISNQRVKECNRIEAMRLELKKFGVTCKELDDGIVVPPCGDSVSPTTEALDGVFCYDDHRVAMSMSLLGILKFPVLIRNRYCVSKTWPGWFICLRNQLKVDLEAADWTSEDLKLMSNSRLTSSVANDAVTDCKSIVLVGMRGVGKTYLGKELLNYWNNFSIAKPYRPASAANWERIEKEKHIFKYKETELLQFCGHRNEGQAEWAFLDLDDVFANEMGMDCVTFSKSNSMNTFRILESQLLKRALSENPTYTIIATGGGCIESAETVAFLSKVRSEGHLVLFLQRDGVSYGKASEGRIDLNESFETTWRRRIPLYNAVCDFILYEDVQTQADTKCLALRVQDLLQTKREIALKREINRFKVLSQKPVPSNFLCLANKRYDFESTLREAYYQRHSAIEIRVDCLESFEYSFVCQQVSHLRVIYPDMPLVYTVRTEAQGGCFPATCVDDYLELLELGFKLACEVVDVEIRCENCFTEISWNDKLGSQLKAWRQSYPSLIMTSFHDPEGIIAWCPEAEALRVSGALSDEHSSPADGQRQSIRLQYMTDICSRAVDLGGDIIKLVSYASSDRDNLSLEIFRLWTESRKDLPPICAINMGLNGQGSRIKNAVLTPVCASAGVSLKSAPGQLTIDQIVSCAQILGLRGFYVDEGEASFYLFGKPISQSQSPKLHNHIFQNAGLHHLRYALFETDSTAECMDLILRQTQFSRDRMSRPFGASVTIPLKESLRVALLADSKNFRVFESSFARLLGAANTIYVPAKRSGVSSAPTTIYLDNTDWRAMYQSLCKGVSVFKGNGLYGIVIGAGGTASAAVLALFQAGAKRIFLYNRTLQRAKALLDHYKLRDPAIYGRLALLSDGGEPLNFPENSILGVIGTVPGDSYTKEPLKSWINNVLPSATNRLPVILLEMAYTPAITLLLDKYLALDSTSLQSDSYGKYSASKNTLVFSGKDLLIMQGLFQSQIWLEYEACTFPQL